MVTTSTTTRASEPTSAPPAGRRMVRSAFAACVAADALWLVTATSVPGGWRWLTLAVVVAIHLGLVVAERRFQVLDRRAVLLASTVLVVVAVAVVPFGSADVWSYAMYGRILGLHHLSPYTHAPSHYPHDPLLTRVAASWRRTPSVYGPVFNAVSALGAIGYRDSAFRARLFYQSLAGASLIASVALLLARRVSTWAIALVALAPIALASVNGAHNDLVVAFALLLGVMLLVDGRPLLGGVSMAVATLVKLLGAPFAAGAIVALLMARRRRDAAVSAAGFAVVVVGGYLIAGGPKTLHPLHRASTQVSSGSIIAGLRWAIFHLTGHGHLGPLGHPTGRLVVATVAAVALFALFAYRERDRPDVAVYGSAALLVYLLTAPYALPWYATALLIPAALATPRLRWLSLAALVALQAGHMSSAGAQLDSVTPLATHAGQRLATHAGHLAVHAVHDVVVPFGLNGARLAACAQVAILVLLVTGSGAHSGDRPGPLPPGLSPSEGPGPVRSISAT